MGVSLNQFLTKGLVSSSGWHLNLGAYQVDLFTVFALGKTEWEVTLVFQCPLGEVTEEATRGCSSQGLAVVSEYT